MAYKAKTDAEIKKEVSLVLGKRKQAEIEGLEESKRKTKILKLSPELVGIQNKGRAKSKKRSETKKQTGKSNHETMTREAAEACIAELSVAITGARPLEILTGCSKATTGNCTVRLSAKSGIIKPHWARILGICQYPDLRDRFIYNLGKIQFFAEMKAPEDRFGWIEQNASRSRDFDIASEPGDPVCVQILQVGGKLTSDLVDPEELKSLMQSESSNELEAKAIYKLFSKKTLFWLRSMWKIAQTHKLVTETKHMVLDATIGKIANKSLADYKLLDTESKEMFEISYELGKLAIVVHKPNAMDDPVITLDNCLEYIHQHEMVVDVPISTQLTCRAIFDMLFYCMSLAFFKSQLQKFVRLPSKEIDFTDFEQEVRQFYRARHGKDLEATTKDFFLPAPYALMMSICYIITHSGIFIPNIQKFVTGLESLIRRLIIIKAEDANITSSELPVLFKMASCLLLAQRVSSWKPTLNQVQEWFTVGIGALFQNTCLVFDVTKGKSYAPYKLFDQTAFGGLTEFQAISAILEDGGMEGDHGMLRYLAKHKSFDKRESTEVLESKTFDKKPCVASSLVNKSYCPIDQHCAADFLYFYPDLDLLATMVDTKTKQVFKPILEAGFQQVSGVNARRTKEFKDKPERTWNSDFETRSFVEKYRFAQLAYMKRALEQTVDSDTLFESKIVSIYRAKYELDIGWIAGGVGPIYFKKTGLTHLLVTLDIEYPQQMSVFRKPARDTKQEPISKKEEADALAEARKILILDGIRWFSGKAHADPPLSSWVGGRVYLDKETEQFYVKLLKPETKEPIVIDEEEEQEPQEDGDVRMKPRKGDKKFQDPVSWEELRQVHIKIPSCNMPDKSHFDVLTSKCNLGSYVCHDFQDKITKRIERMSLNVIRSIKTLLIGFNSKIEVGRISMDGSSTAQPISLADIHAYQFLCYLCVWIPAAIRHDLRMPTRFVVTNGPLLWQIRDQVIFEAFKHRTAIINSTKKSKIKWPPSTESKRSPRDYQADAIQQNCERMDNGQIMHINNMSIGSGKTLVSIKTAQYCVEEHGADIDYIIVICPNDVRAEAVNEWELEGFTGLVDIVIPIQKVSEGDKKSFGKKLYHIPKPSQTLRRGHVSIIDYNHLKQLQDRLMELAPKAFFVFDEMHKIVEEKTLRTNICQRLASNAYNSLGMTGTLIIDADTHRIVIWLKYILNWHVTEGNFMVAVAAIVSKLSPPVAKTIEYEILSKWPSTKLEEEYKSLVSPDFGGIRDRPGPKHHFQALNCCYSAALTDMARVAKLWMDRSTDLDWFNSAECKAIVQNQKITANGLFVVVKDNEQVELFYNMITRGEFKCLEPDQVRKIQVGATFRLTDEEVESKRVQDYRMVIAPQTKTLGYNLSRMAGVLCGTWPSNLATRSQYIGRVNRIKQRRLAIPVIRCSIGIQDLIRTGKHASAQGLVNSLSLRADKINNTL